MFHNKYAAATAQLQGLIRSNPNDARNYAAYALVLNYEIKQKPALDQALQAQKLAPNDGFVLTILTRVEDWNNNIDAAATDGAAAVKVAPGSALARAFYGEALADVATLTNDPSKYAQAQTELMKGADLAKKGTDYERAEVERNWGNFYRDKHDYTQALNHLKLAATNQPNWVERLLELAQYSAARQDLADATSYLERAAILSPDDASLREELGDIGLFAQDYAVAKSAYQAALQLQPRSALDLKVLGDIAVALDHDASTAAQDERAAVAADPTDQEAGAFLVAVLRYLMNDAAGATLAAQHTVAPPSGASTTATYIDLDQAELARQTEALLTLNTYRHIAGLAPVGSSSIIHNSALAHAFYTFFNGASPSIRDLGIHTEQSSGQGYVGADVLSRAQHFGYPTGSIASMAEVITHQANPGDGVTDWIDSVYHRIPLLRGDLLEVGFGDAYLGPMSVQVMDMSFKQTSSSQIILYPAPNQPDVPAAFNGNEIPDPAPNANYPIGYPITAIFDRNASVQIASFHLFDASGADVPGITLQPSNETENSFAFMANAPLQPGAVYKADLSGTVNGAPFHKTWQFTTVSGASAPPVQTAAALSAN